MGTSGFAHTNRRKFQNAAGRVQMALDDGGINDGSVFYQLEEDFALLPALQAASILTNDFTSSPTTAQLAAAAAANAHFEHLGTNTEVYTFANQFDFGGGIKQCTATADADSAITLPILISGKSNWSTSKQWASQRQPRFAAVVTPTPASQITTVALTTNVALITTGAAHGLFPGEKVSIVLDKADSDYAATSSLENTVANPTWTILAVPTTTTFTFAYTRANVSSASIAGSCKPASDMTTGPAALAVTTIALTTNVVTVTCAQKHGLSADDVVSLTIDRTSAAYLLLSAADAALLVALEGNQTVTSAYSAAATTFTFSKTQADIVSGLYTGGIKLVNAGSPQLRKTEIWAGLKLTNDPVVATDNDQCFFKYDASISPFWYLITSRGGTDISTPLQVKVEMGVSYLLEIEVQSDRTVVARINGKEQSIGTSQAALTAGVDLIPYVGVKAAGVVPAAKAICLSRIGCKRAPVAA